MSTPNRSRWRGRSLIDGRLVDHNDITFHDRLEAFSIYRFVMVLAFSALFWYSNPPNIPRSLLEHYTPPQYDRFLQSIRHQRSLTNYGFVSVKEGYSKIHLVGLGGIDLVSLNCEYGKDTLRSNICEQLRANLCHEGPLIYHPTNRAYSIHRLISWSMVIIALLATCFRRPDLIFWSSSVWKDSILSIFLDTSYTFPLWPALWNILCSSLLLYPTLDRVNQVVPLQHSDSVFRVFTDDDSNYIVSCLSLLSIAVAINAISKIWSSNDRCTLKFDAVTAVAFGYYRGSQMFKVNSYVLIFSDGPSLTSITWILALVTWSRHSFLSAILWLLGNILGASMGQYQYEYIYMVSSVRDLTDFMRSGLFLVQDVFENMLREIQGYNNRRNRYF